MKIVKFTLTLASIVQIIAAIAWSTTGATWAHGLFVPLVIIGTALQLLTALIACGVMLWAAGSDDFATKIKADDKARKAISPRLRRKLVALVDTAAIIALAVAGHPWWALLYVVQCLAEALSVVTFRATFKLHDEAVAKAERS